MKDCHFGSWSHGILTDIVSPETRSRMMSGIQGKNTQPEMTVRRALHAAGFRYRLHVPSLPGRPDLVLPKYSAVCLIHGCYWHRHSDCPNATTPATRTGFWQQKFRANVERDERQRQQLQSMGWRVAVIWECALKPKRADAALAHLIRWLPTDAPTVEIG